MDHSVVLQVQNLVKTYPTASGSFVAVDNVNFILEKGEVLGILGPNGAGKTTIIQMLLSVLQPTSGSIHYFNKDLATHRSAILQHVSFASSYVRLPAQLTVWTNLDIFAQLYGIAVDERAARIEKFLKFFGMWNLADKETGTLSVGQMTRVMLAKAFISKPRIVLLDEPTASLDPEIADKVRAFIKEQQRTDGISLLLTSHNMEEVTQLCNRVLVLKEGQIIANNTPNYLAKSVSSARLHLTTDMPEKLIQFLIDHKIDHSHEAQIVTIEVDEQAVAQLLTKLAQQGITYTQISIDTPNLHDYFMSIVREISSQETS